MLFLTSALCVVTLQTYTRIHFVVIKETVSQIFDYKVRQHSKENIGLNENKCSTLNPLPESIQVYIKAHWTVCRRTRIRYIKL